MDGINAAISGFLVGLSLIVAIGAQNAFVLRQGLRGQHVALVCTCCALSDAILIAIGVAGFGTLVTTWPLLDPILRLAGIVFLVVYGLMALRSAWRGGSELFDQNNTIAQQSWLSTLATCLALTWLNPHVYLDTVVLMGSVSRTFEGYEVAFASGGITASFLFFFTLGYGSSQLRPLFAHPMASQILDALIGILMLGIAGSLAQPWF